MRAGSCIHFRPLTGDYSRCAKGISYVDEFKVPGKPVMLTAPCVTLAERFQWQAVEGKRKLVAVLVPVNRQGEEEAPCAWREFPTDEQLHSHEQRLQSAAVTVHGRQWWQDKD